MSRTSEIRHGRALGLAIASAVGTSSSCPLAKALFEGGWSPVGVAFARAALATLVLVVPALLVLRGQWRAVWGARHGVAALGVLGVAGLVICYFNAVMRLPVGVAMMIQYTSPVLVLCWTSWRLRKLPSVPTLVGAATAMVGLLLVVGLVRDAHMSTAGVLWACGGAVCLATYFAVADSLSVLPPVGLACLSVGIGSLTIGAVAATGLMPMTWSSDRTEVAGHATSWVVLLTLLVLISTVFAYVASMASVGVLGARLASFVSLSELVAAVLLAWVLLGEVPRPVQLVGGALIGAGVVLIRNDSMRGVPVS